jgi:hypothetical protein
MTHLGQPLVKIGQTLVQTPFKPFDPPMSLRTFIKFHLNTSNSPSIKVVQFVEGHNFHVRWHLRFGVSM